MTGHGMVIRSWRESEGLWLASAEAVSEGATRRAASGEGEPRDDSRRATWPVEVAAGETEGEAVTEAVQRLMLRGLEPLAR